MTSFLERKQAIDNNKLHVEAYLQRGWRVFKLQIDNKRPATPRGHKDATNDPQETEKMFSEVAYNLGIATGAGLVVIDIDVGDGKDGFASLAGLESKYGALPDTYTVNTPSGGKHLYFSYRGNITIKSGTSKHGEGVDIKAEGGYIVAPPSKLSNGAYVLDDSKPLEVAPLPDAWANLLSSSSPVSSTASGIQTNRNQYVIPSVVEELRQALNFLDCNDRELFIKYGHALYSLDNDDTGFRVWDEWAMKSDKYNARDMGDRWRGFSDRNSISYQTIFHDAALKGWINSGAGGVLPAVQMLPTSPLFKSVGELNENPIYTQWIIKGVMPFGGLGMLWGQPSTGKSFLAVSMAYSVCSGVDWLGHTVKRAGKVLYVAGEGSSGILKRVQALSQTYGKDVSNNFYISTRSVEAIENGELLASSAKYEGVKLIILDTVQRTLNGDENSTQDGARFIRAVDQLKETTGATVLLVHHPDKGGNSARGSGTLKGSVDFEMSITGSGEARQLTSLKQKDDAPFETKNILLKVVTLEGATDEDGEPITSCVSSLSDNQEGATRIMSANKNQMESVRVYERLLNENAGEDVLYHTWRIAVIQEGVTTPKNFSRFFNGIMTRQLLKVSGNFIYHG